MSNAERENKRPQPPLPDKPYYRIGEVARLLGLPTHVLRYWESEFPQLKPVRAPSGQRLFHRRHVEIALAIKELVHEKGYTVKGARQRLEEADGPSPSPDQEALSELKAILDILK